MKPPADLDALTPAQLRDLVVALLGEVATLTQTIGELRAEVARLKGLKGPPDIKPSGMDKATEPAKPHPAQNHPRRGKVRPRVSIEERVLKAAPPPGSRFKGYETYRCRTSCCRCGRSVTRHTLVAPLPEGTRGLPTCGSYHQGQTTLPRTALLRSAV